MANEAYRLRSLAFEWRKRSETACVEFRHYKGLLYCSNCGESAERHAYRRSAEELLALLAEPELLPAAGEAVASDSVSLVSERKAKS